MLAVIIKIASLNPHYGSRSASSQAKGTKSTVFLTQGTKWTQFPWLAKMPDLVLLGSRKGSIYPFLEQIFMIQKVSETSKFGCI